ncbi:hypothetical protein E2C01_036438 [Portunus trituberculatus]|uniref:Uncharacterized protein n=1 Tax=Portunus trituberculatus TaxID=210409 RepID=A0A5B7FB61_PORTR|nr:hypothetical protein [Portunus trituberculatus]
MLVGRCGGDPQCGRVPPTVTSGAGIPASVSPSQEILARFLSQSGTIMPYQARHLAPSGELRRFLQDQANQTHCNTPQHPDTHNTPIH